MWYTHIPEYYSVLKKKEILPPATTWMNLENVMLSKISPSQKDKCCMIPLIWGIWNSQVDRESRIATRGWREEGNAELLFNRYRIFSYARRIIIEVYGTHSAYSKQYCIMLGKDPDAGKDWRQEKRVTEDEMITWHHWFNGHELGQSLGDGEV